jgi:PTH1 family peptidyl-tRNA hydrolase
MHLLVGLGNPGAAYSRNRHNIGFMAADEIVRRHGFSAWRGKFQSAVSEGMLGAERVILLKPQTFMNLSGQAVAAAARFHKIEPDAIIVFHDELDLPPGKIRLKQGGGAGGHNGLKSIDAHLGPLYWRVRLGIGHPGDRALVNPWVLGDFAKDDQLWVEPMLDGLARHLRLLLAGQANDYMNKIKQSMPPPPGPAAAQGEA